MPISRAFTVTTTKLRQNTVCAIQIVVCPSGMPRLTNSTSSEEPATTSGVAIGTKIKMLARPFPGSRAGPARTRQSFR